jgi:lipid II:glycine glycyltransferase (peptidoglycan interpeptide bridge formation enzyme)
VAAFEEVYGRMSDVKGATRHPTSFFYGLRDFCRKWPRRGFLLSSWLQDKLLGAVVVFTLGERAIYGYGTSVLEKPEVPKNHLLHFAAMQRARARGCTLYDWGGFAAPAGKEESNTHTQKINFFKSRFGGHPVDFVPAHERILHPHAYRILRGMNTLWRRIRG